MRKNNLHRWIAPHHGIKWFNVSVFLLLSCSSSTHAQPPADELNDNPNGAYRSRRIDPTLTVLVTVLFAVVLLISLVSICLRNCSRTRVGVTYSVALAQIQLPRKQRGLDPSIIETLPVFEYSEVKEVKLGREIMACAVCLSEFQDEETLRLLPKCDHVFHAQCIDTWLAAHVTCPVCRADLSIDVNPGVAATTTTDTNQQNIAVPPPGTREEVAITVNEGQNGEFRPTTRSDDTPNYLKSHSTGHSIAVEKESKDKYRLRLPEEVRKQLIAKATFKRSTTFNTALTKEWRFRKVYNKNGEGWQIWRLTTSPMFLSFGNGSVVKPQKIDNSGAESATGTTSLAGLVS
ncbi:hypothetical protein K2173_025907 [Erythroxylum novogranatense]|uniref:RING-type E3 ubiquitin transferase n=1 Tax=Erythroxylum novogranatense TaxID=1862640 RepID=A0AAV8TW20_9ROSI|nr:hypothetical protein K2173_025907 [Erythroxylum novogranatense]